MNSMKRYRIKHVKIAMVSLLLLKEKIHLDFGLVKNALV